MDYPIVLVPGMLASMGDDIIPGTGDFDFGLAKSVYKPLLNNLKSMGYKLDKNLFIAFYDWRKENQDSAKRYLVPTIEKAKKESGKEKVNLVSHSMGGLVARSYVQGDQYKNDVDKLIMFGTPNAGSASAYFFWEGGQIPSERSNGNVLNKLLWKGFVWYLKKINHKNDDLISLRRMFPSVKQLLPSNEYGGYLYTNKVSNLYDFIPIKEMKIQNDFLNKLNSNSRIMHSRGVKVYLIVGEGYETEQYYYVGGRKNALEWVDGKPEDIVNTLKGDGVVTCESCTAVHGDVSYIKENHSGILKKSKNELLKILNRKAKFSRRPKKVEKSDDLYMILVKGAEDIYIHKGDKKASIRNNVANNDDRLYIRRINRNSFWVSVDPKYYKNSNVEIIPFRRARCSILIMKSQEDKDVVQSFETNTRNIYRFKIE